MRKIVKNIDKPLLLMSILLFICGLVMVFSASNVTAYMTRAVSPYNYFIKQAIFLGGSFIVSFIMIRFNTKVYGMVSHLFLIGITASLVALLIYGKAQNQAISWFDFGPISIQPSEFAKMIMLIWMTRYYETHANKLNHFWTCFFPLIIGGLIAFLIIFQPDLGTAIIYSLIVIAVFFMEPIPKGIKNKILLTGIGLVAIVCLVFITNGKTLVHSRQLERLHFQNPCSRLLSTGGQVCNGYIAMNNGGLTGVGLGNSTQKYLYLDEPYTDFIFAVIVEELGALTGILLLLSYLFVLWRIYLIGKRSYTERGAVLCYGVLIYIFLHIAVNLLGIMGLIPLTGVGLPFMSYGGSFTLSLVIALTLVQRVAVETGLRKTAHAK